MKVLKSLTLLFVLVFAVAAFSKANIGLNGIGGKIGYVDPEGDVESTIGFGAVADLGTITPKIALEADVFYWGKSYDEHFYGSTGEAKFTSITVSAVGKYLFADSREQLRPFAGAGLGLAFNKFKVESEYTDPWTGHTEKYSDSSSDTDFMIQLCGGAKYQLSPKLDGFAELRYSLGDGDVLSILVGAIYSLTK